MRELPSDPTTRTSPNHRQPYWISSSARSSHDFGAVRPIALAVLMLMNGSNFACSTGRSLGFAPLGVLSIMTGTGPPKCHAEPKTHRPVRADLRASAAAGRGQVPVVGHHLAGLVELVPLDGDAAGHSCVASD